jgi:hypothetical protein
VQKLSCSFQDGAPGGRPAKPLKLNALGPKLSCSLQDVGGGAFGHEGAAAAGSVPSLLDAASSTASGNRDAPSATSSDYRAPPGRTRRRLPAADGENPRGASVDNPADYKPVVEDDTEKAETSLGSKDNGGSRSRGFLRARRSNP